MVLPRPPSSSPSQHHQIAMTPAPSRKTAGSGNGDGKDVRRRVNMCMSRLSDRDTEAMAASELESMARDLPADSLPSFLSAIADTRPSDKTPLRRHCVRLLSLLSRARQPQSLAPFLPRMLAAALRRIRDPDSSVRAACVDAVRDMARSSRCGAATSSFCAVFLRPLAESLVLEQDGNAQTGSAMCLAAAIDEVSADGDRGACGGDLVQHLNRLVPRLVKMAKSDGFRAKPALLSLLGSVVAAGGASTPALLAILVPCLVDALASDDWAARKASAEALTRVAAIPDAHLLAGFKSSHFASFQTRRFDKVKIVRESMNRMLEAWKGVPDALDDEDGGIGGNTQPSQSRSSSAQKENVSDGQPVSGTRPSISDQSATPKARKSRSTIDRSSPTDALSTPARRTPQSTGKRMNQPVFHKFDHKKPSDWQIEVAIPQASTSRTLRKYQLQNDKESDGKVCVQCEDPGNCGSKLEVKKLALENSEGKVNKFETSKSGSCVIPVQELVIPGHIVDSGEALADNKDSDLSLIRKQLVQIENQQSSLLDLLQRFIENSQSGIHSLETRVHGLEIAMDELCHVFGITPNTDPVVHCCKIPGAGFLSSKLWRRAEGRYSSKFSISATLPKPRMQNPHDNSIMDSLKWGKQTFGRKGGFVVNPLAEVNSLPGRNSGVSPKRMMKSMMHDTENQQAHNSSRIDNTLTMTTTTDMITRSSQVS